MRKPGAKASPEQESAPPKSRKAVTAEEVHEWFKEAGGRGPIPTKEQVEPLVREIRDPVQSGAYGVELYPRKAAKAAKHGPTKQLFDALKKVRPLVFGEMRLGYEDMRAKVMLDLASAITSAMDVMAEEEPFVTGQQRMAVWHDRAAWLARLIKRIYTRAGRKHVGFSDEKSPAIKVLHKARSCPWAWCRRRSPR